MILLVLYNLVELDYNYSYILASIMAAKNEYKSKVTEIWEIMLPFLTTEN